MFSVLDKTTCSAERHCSSVLSWFENTVKSERAEELQWERDGEGWRKREQGCGGEAMREGDREGGMQLSLIHI